MNRDSVTVGPSQAQKEHPHRTEENSQMPEDERHLLSGAHSTSTANKPHPTKLHSVLPVRSRTSSLTSTGCSVFSSFNRRRTSSPYSPSVFSESERTDISAITDYSSLPSGRSSRAENRRSINVKDGSNHGSIPIFECVFWFLDCPFTSHNQDQWKAHCSTHLQGHDPPNAVKCPLCDDFEEYHYEDGQLAWARKLDHLARHHFLLGQMLRNNAVDQNLLSFLWQKNMISERQYEEWKEISREGSPLLMSEEMRSRLLRARKFTRMVDVTSPGYVSDLEDSLSEDVPLSISRWLNPPAADVYTVSHLIAPQIHLELSDIEEEEEDAIEDIISSPTLESASEVGFSTQADNLTDKAPEKTPRSEHVEEKNVDHDELLDRLMETAASLFDTMRITQYGAPARSNGPASFGLGVTPGYSSSGSDEHNGSSRKMPRRNSRQGRNRGAGDGDGGDGDDETTPGFGATESKKLACPYFKRDPQKYQRVRSCPGPGWDTVHRLK